MRDTMWGWIILVGGLPLSFGGTNLLAQEPHHNHGSHGEASAGGWRMVPMPPGMFMLPGLEREVPRVGAFLPGAGVDPSTIPDAVMGQVMRVQDGASIELEAGYVRRSVKGHEFIAYGYNGQYPGPLIRVDQGASITVTFKNSIEWPSTIHWHGLRLENRFDGVPHLTQELVMPGESFVYEVTFPDAGIYWYHPHHREDVTLGMGLFGNLLVDSPDPDYYGPAHRDEILILDDLLVDDLGLFPFGEEAATHTLMGRFGNVMLVNGRPAYELEVNKGEVVRFHLTNASNTRTYNLSFGGQARMKLVASDLSRFEREQWIESVVLAPAERYVLDVQFVQPGITALLNEVQGLDHIQGRFFSQVDTLGLVDVLSNAVVPDLSDNFDELRGYQAVSDGIDPFRSLFHRPPDHSLTLSVRPVSGPQGRLPVPLVNFIEMDTIFYPPVEWNDAMPDMNWLATTDNLEWVIRDDATGVENMEIDWTFRVGDVVKMRIWNDPSSFHPMQHPIHVHGQRFLVLSQDGVPRTNLVWKDTAVVPTGSTVDILVEMSNPGDWMVHCHILEHAGAGMMMAFSVLE